MFLYSSHTMILYIFPIESHIITMSAKSFRNYYYKCGQLDNRLKISFLWQCFTLSHTTFNYFLAICFFDAVLGVDYRKSSIRSRPLIQVYPIRGRNLLSDTSQIHYQNFDFCLFLGSLGDPLSPNEKIFSIKLIIFKVPLIQV